MEPRLQLFLIVLSLGFMIYIFSLVRREELDLKYTMAWCLMGFVLVLIAIQPRIVVLIAEVKGSSAGKCCVSAGNFLHSDYSSDFNSGYIQNIGENQALNSRISPVEM